MKTSWVWFLCLFLLLSLVIATIVLSVKLHQANGETREDPNLEQRHIELVDNVSWQVALEETERFWSTIHFIDEPTDKTMQCARLNTNGPAPNYFATHPGFDWSYEQSLANLYGYQVLTTKDIKFINDTFQVFINDVMPSHTITMSVAGKKVTSCLNDIAVDQAKSKDGVTVRVNRVSNLLNHMSIQVAMPQGWYSPNSGQGMLVMQLGIQAGVTLLTHVTGDYYNNTGNIDVTFALSYSLKMRLEEKADGSGIRIAELVVGGAEYVASNAVSSSGVPKKAFGLVAYQSTVATVLMKVIGPKLTAMLTGPQGLAQFQGISFPDLIELNSIGPMGVTSKLNTFPYAVLVGTVPLSVSPGIEAADSDTNCDSVSTGATFGWYDCIVLQLMQDYKSTALSFESFQSFLGEPSCQNVCGATNTNVHPNHGCVCCYCPGGTCNTGPWSAGCALTGTGAGGVNVMGVQYSWEPLYDHVVFGSGWGADAKNTRHYIKNLSFYDHTGGLQAGPFNGTIPSTNPQIKAFASFGTTARPLVDVTWETPLNVMRPGILYFQKK